MINKQTNIIVFVIHNFFIHVLTSRDIIFTEQAGNAQIKTETIFGVSCDLGVLCLHFIDVLACWLL
jgi:hypothetical protein